MSLLFAWLEMELVIVTRKTSPALLEEVVRLEKKWVALYQLSIDRTSVLTRVLFGVVVIRIFPKHESMAESLVKEALKMSCMSASLRIPLPTWSCHQRLTDYISMLSQNTVLLAIEPDASVVVGYILYRRSGVGPFAMLTVEKEQNGSLTESVAFSNTVCWARRQDRGRRASSTKRRRSGIITERARASPSKQVKVAKNALRQLLVS